MRTIGLASAAAILLAAAPASAERWFRVSTSDASIAYVDADSIGNEGGNRYATSYSVYAEPIDNSIYAGAIRSEYHCDENYFRTLEYSYHGSSNEHLGTEPSETINERKVPLPGSVNEAIMTFVCSGSGGIEVANAWSDGRAIFAGGK